MRDVRHMYTRTTGGRPHTAKKIQKGKTGPAGTSTVTCRVESFVSRGEGEEERVGVVTSLIRLGREKLESRKGGRR